LAKGLSRATLLTMARVGAQRRIEELESEIATIRRTFGMGGGRGRKAASAGKPKRRRRKMSAEARKKISDAQTRRWAKQKAKK
jgi:hypothetical protein